MMRMHGLLLCMFFTYVCAIVYVGYQMDHDTKSISKVITEPENQKPIFAIMCVMAASTIAYEWNRKNNCSFGCILSVLCGVFGVIWFEENTLIHYGFAWLVFCSILCFMYIHRSKHLVLSPLLAMQLTIAEILLLQFNNNILVWEILFLFVFAVYYLTLHFIQYRET